jgi:hypothetical protein
LSFSVHPAAEGERADAARFYRQEAGRAAAVGFIEEFDRVAVLPASNPTL